MKDILNRLEELKTEIEDVAEMDRLAFEPEITRLVAQLDEQHETVPKDIRNLADELMSEAIEARFDNMPV
ncbi:hypothetical protein [Roseovarius sp. 2305UL8-3]|uniref:hypothetical protein n=1 Tax=Roseovarius conchicola TaxID=3121636 RepID=UPI0035294753